MNFSKLVQEATNLFNSDKKQGNGQKEAIYYLLDKLDHKEKKLRKKLEAASDMEQRNDLVDKIRILTAHKKQGLKKLKGFF